MSVNTSTQKKRKVIPTQLKPLSYYKPAPSDVFIREVEQREVEEQIFPTYHKNRIINEVNTAKAYYDLKNIFTDDGHKSTTRDHDYYKDKDKQDILKLFTNSISPTKKGGRRTRRYKKRKTKKNRNIKM